MASVGGVGGGGGIAAGGSALPPSGPSGRRAAVPRPLSLALVLLHTLFAVTVIGGLGLLLTASSYDAVDGGVLALIAYAAAPGTLGWWLARRTRQGGGQRTWGALIAVQAWLILGSISNLAEGSTRGATQLLLPVLILYFLTRRESRDWYRLPEGDRAARRPFSLARMIRWRRDEGQTAVEYAGLIAVVAAIITALVVSGLGTQIFTGIQSQICRVTGTACPAPEGGDGQVNAGDGPGDEPGDGPGDGTADGRGGDTDGTAGDDGDTGDGNGDAGEDGNTDPDVADPVAAADEIDEPPYEDPTTDEGEDGDDPESDESDEGDGGDGGDDEGCFSGFGAFFGCAGDQLKQVGEGLFVDGIWGDLTGMWDTITNPVETWNGLMDYGSSLGEEWWNNTADARQKWDDGDYFGAILDWGGASLDTGGTVLFDMFIGDDVVDQWNSGNETRAVTTVLWNVGSLFIPGYGEAKIVEKLGTLGRLSRVADDAAEAAQDARRAAEAGDLDALEDAARRADEAADEAEDAARRTGCTISAPPRRIPYRDDVPTAPAPGMHPGATEVLAAAPARTPYVVLAEGGCDEEAQEQAREAREHERQAYLERKRAEEPQRAREALENKKQWPDPERNDTSDPRNYNPPDWAEDLQSRTYGDADNGDGFWASRDRNPKPGWKNESWLRYQEQVTGTQRGYEYVVPHTDPDVPDVEFDGWDSSRQTYLEAKNGYDSFLTADRTELTPSGRERLLTEARRQTEAARGKPVEWHFSNEEVADAARDAFEDAGLDIEVVHTAPNPVAGDRKPEAFD
ncbi:Tox-REase-5 domain-containing protein [Streptomyces sp. NPDC052013]|uniref:Tox-REase-5 domain-containing protein n=1 Tax=Streptomyces sp. NPDC052013 TaxID=3365679 RepID=UPI0037CDA1E2